MTDVIRNETPHAINGCAGRLFTLRKPPAPWSAGTFASQTWTSETRKITGYGAGADMAVDIRFDDQCKNGHNTLAITAKLYTPASRKRNDCAACGCLHSEIQKFFPELSHLIQWHGATTDGPMHYLANTLYHASDRDPSGRAAGEASNYAVGYRFGNSPITSTVSEKFFNWIESRRGSEGEFHATAIAYQKRAGTDYAFTPNYTLVGFGEKWHDCPFKNESSAHEFAAALNTCEVHPVKIPTAYSEGKKRELDHARACAIWPEATDEKLCLPKAELEKLLVSRLPALLVRMRADIENAGFMWFCPSE